MFTPLEMIVLTAIVAPWTFLILWVLWACLKPIDNDK
jgi:hypothetical protein